MLWARSGTSIDSVSGKARCRRIRGQFGTAMRFVLWARGSTIAGAPPGSASWKAPVLDFQL